MADRNRRNDKDQVGKDAGPKVPVEKGRLEKTSVTEQATEAVKPEAEKFIETLIQGVMSGPSVARMIERLPLETRQTVGRVLPTALGWLIGRIPENLLGDPSLTDFLKDMLSKAALTVGVQLRERPKDKPMDEAAVKEAVKKAAEAELVLDPLGQVHVPTCHRVMGLKKFEQKSINLVQAISQRAILAPCCHQAVENRIDELVKTKAASAPKSATSQSGLSPLKVIGLLKDDQKAEFIKWLDSLPEDVRREAYTSLQELDSVDEAVGFLAMPAKIRLEMLPFLRDRNAVYGLKKLLGDIGDAIKSGWKACKKTLKKLWRAVKKLDKSCGPKVDELIARLQAPAPTETLWQKFKSVINPF